MCLNPRVKLRVHERRRGHIGLQLYDVCALRVVESAGKMAAMSCMGAKKASVSCGFRAGTGRKGLQAGRQVRGADEREAALGETMDGLDPERWTE